MRYNFTIDIDSVAQALSMRKVELRPVGVANPGVRLRMGRHKSPDGVESVEFDLALETADIGQTGVSKKWDIRPAFHTNVSKCGPISAHPVSLLVPLTDMPTVIVNRHLYLCLTVEIKPTHISTLIDPLKTLALGQTPYTDCIFVSECGNEYYIHSKAAAKQSEYFRTLIEDYKNSGYGIVRLLMPLDDFCLYAFLAILSGKATLKDYMDSGQRCLISLIDALAKYQVRTRVTQSLLLITSHMITKASVLDFTDLALAYISDDRFGRLLDLCKPVLKTMDLDEAKKWRELKCKYPNRTRQLEMDIKSKR